MIRVWVVGRCSRSASLVCVLSQVCDVVVEPQILIPKESHLLYQLRHPVWGQLWRWDQWLSWCSFSPWIFDISHVGLSCSCSCSCDEPACCWAHIVFGAMRNRGRIP